ncbi:MAG: hypothetical protein CMN25_16095 [Salinicola sp.]|nr:hypothetical protein [Salinicola sp.]
MDNGLDKDTELSMMFVDGSYVGRRVQIIHQQHGLVVEVVSHSTNANVGRWCLRDQDDLFTLRPGAKFHSAAEALGSRTHPYLD